MKFNDAFRQARKDGKKVFDWNGRRYTTELAKTTDANTKAVKELQTILKDKGLYKGSIDGIFGPLSETALESFGGKLPYIDNLPSWIPISNKRDKEVADPETRVTQEDKPKPIPKPVVPEKDNSNFTIPDTIVGGKSFGVSIGPPVRKRPDNKPKPKPKPTEVPKTTPGVPNSQRDENGWIGLTDYEMGDLDGLDFDLDGKLQKARLSGPDAWGFDAVETRAFSKDDKYTKYRYQQVSRDGKRAKEMAKGFLNDIGLPSADSMRVRFLDRYTYDRPVYEMQYMQGNQWHNYDSAVVAGGMGIFSNYDAKGRHKNEYSDRQRSIMSQPGIPGAYERNFAHNPWLFRTQLNYGKLNPGEYQHSGDEPLMTKRSVPQYQMGGPMNQTYNPYTTKRNYGGRGSNNQPPQYFLGGLFNGLNSLNQSQIGNISSVGGSLLGFLPQTNKEGHIATGTATAKGALSGFAKGASLGSVIPGLGTAIGGIGGALIGGISSLLGAKKQNKEMVAQEEAENQQRMQYGIAQSNPYGNFKMGGAFLTPNTMFKSFNGLSHEQGGIPVDLNMNPTTPQQAVAEVEKRETVLKFPHSKKYGGFAGTQYIFNDTTKFS